MFEEYVKDFVADRGFGPWCQRQAWIEVGRLPLSMGIFALQEVLEARWGKL